ncbi:response regulator transcription factor [Glycomyces sp. A-F 0318]|uniref:response regulator transcription factor n=1 Tax=Glycomyces amatae TaxID=2881355 RepID=UPI001E2E1A99|nr:response regulator transcription factor [Glycomyces amatae]MCD0443185.1 response regulator transcription factor [Glycomyces amatae]
MNDTEAGLAGSTAATGFHGETEPGAAKSRVLVVDDEENIGALLSATLRLTGFDVEVATTAAECFQAAGAFRPDLVILDVMLPDLDGFEVAKRLHADHQELPVLFLTARHSVRDRVAGLTLGADDYVTKPFDLEEVLLRVQAILRRSKIAQPSEEQVMRYADLELDEALHEVRRAKRPVQLSPTEFRLLQYLMINAGKVVSKDQILDRVWGYDFGGNGRIVESYVYYLRKKIDAEGVPLIHTIRGFGYALRLPRPQ